MTSTPPNRPPLDEQRLRASAPPWAQVEVVPEAGSTNAVVTERARQGAQHGLVVVAEHQTAGRGRLGRTWETPARAALTFSVLVRPEEYDADAAGRPWQLLPLVTGLGVSDALREAGVSCDLKWPNDVLHADLKLGGLLAERVETTAGPAAVLGIGVNVSTTRAELPVPEATSLLEAQQEVPDRTTLLLAMLAALGERLEAWAGGREGPLLADYQARCATLGRAVRVQLPGGSTVTGTATGLDPSGALVLHPDSGPDVVVSAGDVVHVRPEGADPARPS